MTTNSCYPKVAWQKHAERYYFKKIGISNNKLKKTEAMDYINERTPSMVQDLGTSSVSLKGTLQHKGRRDIRTAYSRSKPS